jgi:hypothetical protein
MRELAAEAEKLLDHDIPLRGICLYPVLGMPEWHAPDRWTQMGLWELVEREGKLVREPHLPMIDSLSEAQSRLEQTDLRLEATRLGYRW